MLVGDNASWHVSAETFDGLKQRGLFFIKNVPYSPQLNPIERVFAMIKQAYKKKRVQLLQAGRLVPPRKMLTEVLAEIDSEKVIKTVRSGLDLWKSDSYADVMIK